MHKIILFIILLSVILPLDLKVNVNPDTIYVGSLVNIILTVENNTNDEVVIFYDIEEDINNYTVLDKKLSQNSVEYILQFWNEGHIIITPIPVDIKRGKTDTAAKEVCLRESTKNVLQSFLRKHTHTPICPLK